MVLEPSDGLRYHPGRELHKRSLYGSASAALLRARILTPRDVGLRAGTQLGLGGNSLRSLQISFHRRA